MLKAVEKIARRALRVFIQSKSTRERMVVSVGIVHQRKPIWLGRRQWMDEDRIRGTAGTYT